MTTIDPFSLRIPQAFMKDPEVRDWCERISQFTNETWVAITNGTGVERISAVESSVEGQDSRKLPELRQLTKKVNDIRNEMDKALTELHLLRKDQAKLVEYDSLAAELKRIKSKLNELELSQ